MTYISLAAAVLLVGIDRLTKWLAEIYVKPASSINLISIGGREWLNLTYQENTGAAFSILRDKQLFLIILTSIIILGVIILMVTKRVKKPLYIWSFALILAGGIGNLIDRIAYGYVVDFVDVRIIKFAVFNFADVCAVTGTIMLLVFYTADEIKASRAKKAKAAEQANAAAASTEAADSDSSDTETDE